MEYFILDPNTGNPIRDKQLSDQFKTLYGDRPTAIKIMYPPADKDIFFQQWYKRYGSSTLLKCKGDGEEATCALPEFAQGLKILGQDPMNLTRVECLGQDCIYQKSRECSRVGSLQVLLPDLDAIGVWQIDTGSYNSIVNINSSFEWLAGLCGRYQMIPISLVRVPTDISHTGPDGKQSKGKHYVLQIDMQASLAKLQRAALVAPERTAIAALPAPEEVAPIIDQEQEETDPVEKAKEVFDSPQKKRTIDDIHKDTDLYSQIESELYEAKNLGELKTIYNVKRAADIKKLPQEVQDRVKEIFDDRVNILQHGDNQ